MAIAVVPHSTSYTMPEPLYNQYTAGPSSSITKAYAKSPNDDPSQSSYLPTPTSGGSPFDLQQQQQQQYHQHHQRQQQQYHQQQQVSDSNSTYSPQRQQVYHQPSPSHSNTTSQNNYSPSKANGQSNGMYDHRSPQPVAGPSSYRRTPNLHSPVSVAGDSAERVRGHDRVSAEHSPARGQHQPGRQTAMGEQVMMDGMERMAVDEGDGRIGTEDPFGERRYTELKVLGDGSFGTVWLCDWHSPVKSGTLLSAMQCGAGARPEWSGKRLVALKRMKRVWEGGWSQAKNLGEIYSLSRIPQHPAIIPLYDAFISPKSRELYFVFECMEGNLYQLTKSRRGRPLAAGLIASCFHQISTGLDHIHRHGYFHRDMKPENLLVTTTGLADYLNAEALAYINSARSSSADGNYDPQQLKYEKDVSVIVKLADFGLARATTSKPPYTEYVSTRWYRAPEVLLRSTEYGAPVDMWALGTILAEMLNLKPLFPGVSEIDQVYRITDTLGDPSPNHGVDERGRTIGGGSWNSGIILAKKVGFSFPKRKPVNFRSLFNENVPQSLIDCIGDLLLYNPKYRMTSAQCVQHAYFHETLPHLQRTPPLPRVPFSHGQPEPGSMPKPQPELTAPPRAVPPSHSHHETRPAFANGDMRTLPPPVGMPDMSQSRVIFPTQTTDFERYEASALVNQLRELDLPTEDLHSYGNRPLAKPIQEAGQQPAAVQPNVQAPRAREWSENTTRQSTSSEVPYDGQSNSGQNPSYGQFSLAQQAQIAHMRSQSKVANYVQQQQQIQSYEDGTPRQPAANQVVIPPPIEPTRDATAQPPPSNTGKLASLTIGKKKKWGLSSVFGGGGDKGSTVSLSPISPADHTGYSGGSSSSLKRTQSGNAPAMSSSMLSPTTPIDDASAARVNTDPKLAKKEAEKAKREAEKMKREAAARVQKERARAVMLKRQQIVSAQTGKSDATNIEALSGFTMDPEPQARKPQVTQPPPSAYAPSHYDQSSNQMAVDEQGQGSRHRPMDEGTSTRSIHGMLGASQSATSIRTYDSQRSKNTADKHSLHSYGNSRSQPQLPLSSDQQYGIESGMNSIGRHKARRRDEDDDHSMSSFGHNSMRSRSVLTIGTIDSDPGPRRGRIDFPDMTIPHQASKDPLVSRRPPSNSSRHHHALQPSRLASLSNPSLESQLARDFKAHANVAGSSQTSLHQSMSPQQIPPVPTHGAAQFAAKVGQGSAPTSPYGHPKGIAVAHGGGIGRNGTMLPSIRDWEDGQSSPQPDHQQYNGNINPMFKVPPAEQGRHAQQPTLPPFSDIARVADSHAEYQR